MDSRQQLERLLDEPVAAAEARQQSAFEEATGHSRQIVIFGAGRLGRRVAQSLKGTGVEVLAFTDNNAALWGNRIEGLEVLSPIDAAARYGEKAAFVVCVWHPARHPLMPVLVSQGRALGCKTVPFPLLFWKMPEAFLPYYLWDLPSRLLQERTRVTATYDLLADEASREAFVKQVQLRLRGDFDTPGEPSEGEQYFPGFFSLLRDECFVDCGAFDGDTLRSFAEQTGGAFRKAIMFEADVSVLPRLRSAVEAIGRRAVVWEAAVGEADGTITFRGDGMGGGRAAGAGQPVRRVKLDTALAGEAVSFLKMDIEGAELEALEGARGTIARRRPVLAICAYHQQDHLWRVPALLHELLRGAAIFLRAHRADGFDLVCYAVPEERLREDARRAAAGTIRGGVTELR